MTNVEQIFQAIRRLPVPDRLRLVERVVHDLADVSWTQAERRLGGEEAPSLLGLFADEPDLVDDVCRMAMEARKRDKLRTGSEPDESTP